MVHTETIITAMQPKNVAEVQGERERIVASLPHDLLFRHRNNMMSMNAMLGIVSVSGKHSRWWMLTCCLGK